MILIRKISSWEIHTPNFHFFLHSIFTWINATTREDETRWLQRNFHFSSREEFLITIKISSQKFKTWNFFLCRTKTQSHNYVYSDWKLTRNWKFRRNDKRFHSLKMLSTLTKFSREWKLWGKWKSESHSIRKWSKEILSHSISILLLTWRSTRFVLSETWITNYTINRRLKLSPNRKIKMKSFDEILKQFPHEKSKFSNKFRNLLEN